MSDLVQRLREAHAESAVGTCFPEEHTSLYRTAAAEIEKARRTAEYWKAEHGAANSEIERLTAEIAKLRQDETDEAAACGDTIERQAKEIERLETENESLKDRLRMTVAKLAEARADYDHELIMRQAVEADLAYIRRRTLEITWGDA